MKLISTEYRGGEKYNKKSINRHSIREYKHKGQTIIVDKCTDARPVYYEVYREDGFGHWKQLLAFPNLDGLSWNKAMTLIEKQLDKWAL